MARRSAVVLVACLLAGASQVSAQSSGRLRGVDVPNPLGIGMSFYNQTQPYEIHSLEVQFPGVDATQLEGFKVDNDTSSYHLRIDYWLLPFLNVFGLVGQIDGTTRIDLEGVDLGFPIKLEGVSVPIDGAVYGAGLVLAVGGDKWFATVAYDYTETDLDVATSSVTASVITPKVGLRLKGGAIWIGAMYQEAEEEHEGNFDLPFIGAVPFKVALNEQEPWNYVVGATAGLSEHWVVILQGGVGERDAALATLEYRF